MLSSSVVSSLDIHNVWSRVQCLVRILQAQLGKFLLNVFLKFDMTVLNLPLDFFGAVMQASGGQLLAHRVL
jgi:hypothetical protein